MPPLPSLLVASPQLLDPNFCRSVVLLIEHDSKGAMGFIVNQKSDLNLKEVVSFDAVKIPSHIPVWKAGPIDRSAGFVLHNQKNESFEKEITNGISISSSQESLRKLIESEIHLHAKRHAKHTHLPIERNKFPAFHNYEQNLKKEKIDSSEVEWIYPFRLLVGYAGWGPGQLDQEIEQGAWVPLPLCQNVLFNSNFEDMWHLTLQKIGMHQDACIPLGSQDTLWLH